MSEKILTVDIWGHHSEETDYQRPVQYPYEVDTPDGNTGTTYIRYLNRDNTTIHRIQVSESNSRTSIVRTVGYGAWSDRGELEYFPPERWPKNIVFEFDDEESTSEPEGDSGSETESTPESGSSDSDSGSESEGGSDSEGGSESDSGSDSEGGSGSEG